MPENIHLQRSYLTDHLFEQGHPGISLVGSVAPHINNPHLLPPTSAELEKLVQKLRAMRIKPVPDQPDQVTSYSLHWRITSADMEDIATRYRAGERITDLSREYGMCRQTLRRLLKDEGVAPRQRGMTDADADTAIQLYESGLTVKQIISKIGYSNGVILRMLHKRGVKVRPRRNQG